MPIGKSCYTRNIFNNAFGIIYKSRKYLGFCRKYIRL